MVTRGIIETIYGVRSSNNILFTVFFCNLNSLYSVMERSNVPEEKVKKKNFINVSSSAKVDMKEAAALGDVLLIFMILLSFVTCIHDGFCLFQKQ